MTDRTATLADFVAFLREHPGLMVLTGAGCSTGSGIPAYRDRNGDWQNRPPVRYAEFVTSEAVRRRYWARSMVGWERIAAAEPNRAHVALARLERWGFVSNVVTQNVDGLHQKAGSRRVVDLHGRLDRVTCLECGAHITRADVQELLRAWNAGAGVVPRVAEPAPDGDAPVAGCFDDFGIPACPTCGGVLKPDVVFFGENVPKARAEHVLDTLAAAPALLVVGSSLTVYSGYRLVLAARQLGRPVAALNQGRTRADAELTLKLEADCEGVLAQVVEVLGPERRRVRIETASAGSPEQDRASSAEP